MSDIEPKPKRSIVPYVLLLIVLALVIYFFFAELALATLAALVLSVCVYAFVGKRAGQITLGLSAIALVSAQIHWIGGRTICLASDAHPYLWEMDSDHSGGVFSSTTEEDGSISLSLSARSENLSPGARFGAITAGPGATISPFYFTDLDTPSNEDTVIQPDLAAPETLEGMTLYAPRGAQFQADLAFGTNPGNTAFEVLDLPVLMQISEDSYTPLGILSGPITLGDTADIHPADFDARNLILTGRVRDERSARAREVGRALSMPAEAMLDQTYRDWVLVNPVSKIALNRYAEVHDCRPAAYEKIGLGWLFGPGADWFG